MREMFRRRHLPHWDYPGATYFVTACLQGSIPAKGLLDIRRFRESVARRPRPARMSDADWKSHCWKLEFARAEEWLDNCPAVRHMEQAELAELVADALYFFAARRYEILAYVVMPSHFHWLFTPRADYEATVPEGKSARELIMHSIKRDTAYKCNQRLRLNGPFWQDESYDHCVLDCNELERIIDYIELNPVKAGLAASREEWPYSSAYDRLRHGISIGHPLVRRIAP